MTCPAGRFVCDASWRIVRADDRARRLLQHRLDGVACVGAVPRELAVAQNPEPPATFPCSRCRVLRLGDGRCRTFLLRYDGLEGSRVSVRLEPVDWSLGVLDQLAAPGFAFTDEDGTIVHHNRAWLRWFARPSGAWAGQRAAAVVERFAAHPGDGEKIFGPACGARATADTLPIRGAGGQEHTLQVQGTRWRYRGLRCGSIWLASDATEHVEERQQAALAVWYRLGAMFEHELRNPLQTIQAAADVIRPALPADKLRALDLLEEQVRSIGEYIGDLLQAPPSGALSLGRLSDVVEVSISGAAARAATRQLAFEHRRPGREPSIRMHVPSLGRVFANLFHNSAAARSDATVTISYAVERDVLACTVADNGPGFPPDMVARSLITAQRDATAHLGVLIVASTVEAHGGAVTMSNGLRGGASVVIRLPVATRVTRLGSGSGAAVQIPAP